MTHLHSGPGDISAFHLFPMVHIQGHLSICSSFQLARFDAFVSHQVCVCDGFLKNIKTFLHYCMNFIPADGLCVLPALILVELNTLK